MRTLRQLPLSLVALISILLLATFLRFWNLENTLQFLGDQGRDASIARQILREHRLVLIGPVTSTGNMYLGPLYYYFMVPFLAITYPSPLGPAYAVAIFSIIGVYLTFRLGKEMVGERAALFGAFFIATSSVAVTFSRFSWNPNLAPFIGIILLWSVFRAVKKSPWYWLLTAFTCGILMQLHYVTLLSVGISGVFWLLSLRTIAHQKRSQLIQFVLATLGAVTLFTAFFIPLVLFDLRHQFLNFRSLQSFLTEDSGGFNHGGSTKRLLKAVAETQGRSMQILAEMFIGKFRDLNTLVATVLIGAMAFWSWQKKQQHQVGYQLLFLCVAVSVLILAFYQSSIFPHYLAFLYPITCLIYGVVMEKLVKNLPGKVFALICVGGFLVWNAQHMPFESLSWTVRDTQRTAEMIAQRIKPGEKYNIVLLTSTGDIEGLNYRYFLETTGSPPLPREQWGEADTLYIINEDKRLARVVESPVYEIVVFPNKTPTEVYTIPNGPEITVLRR